MSVNPIKSAMNELEFIYVQGTGALFLADSQDGSTFVGRGYSGKGSAINSRLHEKIIATGPIPRGVWNIRPAIVHVRLGRISIPLAPRGHDAFGRSGFYIHGDNKSANYSASSGCIILPPDVREFVEFCRKRGTTTLTVVDTWIYD